MRWRTQSCGWSRFGLRDRTPALVMPRDDHLRDVLTNAVNAQANDELGFHRPRFPWTPVWANEAGRPGVIGDESGEGSPGGGDGDGGGGAADERGATRAVECAREDGDRAATLEGRGARDRVARDAGAGARARAMAADLSRGRDERVQAPGYAGGRARAQAGAGEGRRAHDEARDRGVVPGKKRSRRTCGS